MKGFERRLDKISEENRPELFCLNTDNIDFKDSTYSNIDVFDYTYQDKTKTFNVKDVIPFWDNMQDSDNMNIGISRMVSLENPINAYYKSQLGKLGKLDSSGHFVVHPSVKSSMGGTFGLALDDNLNEEQPGYTQRQHLEKTLQDGGLARGKSVTVLNTEVGLINLMETIQNYSFDDEVKEDVRFMYSAYQIPKTMTNLEDSGAKYENGLSDERGFYEKVIIPLSENLCRSIKEHYGWENDIVLDYTHLSFYDEIRRAESLNNKDFIEQVIMLKSNEILTNDECRKLLKNKGVCYEFD